MNDKAREVLVKAALDGVPQTYGFYKDPNGGPGRCALGVLAEAIGVLNDTGIVATEPHEKMREQYELSDTEFFQIAEANDSGWDFLTIARKLGVDESLTHNQQEDN
jgi:hypothetical protein